MSTISVISTSTSLYQAYASGNAGTPAQLIQNLDSLSAALQSGDASAAQSALSTLQQSLASSALSSGITFSSDKSAATLDYQNLVSDIQSGNLAAAQIDLAQLQSALNSGQIHGASSHDAGASLASTATAGPSATISSVSSGLKVTV
jgi:hypothetical protein